MDTKKQQMEILHNMCQKELSELQISMERYLQDSERMQQLLNRRSLADGSPPAGRRGVNNIFALIAFDRYMSHMSAVIGMARKFNIHLQLNALPKTVLDTTETLESPTMGMNNSQSHLSQTRFLQDFIHWSNSCIDYEKDSPISSGTDGLSPERKAIELSIFEKAKADDSIQVKEKPELAVHFKFSDLDSFLRSVLPVKELSHFTESHTFSGSITYVMDSTNLVFYICEMKDCGKLYEISSSPDKTLINKSSLSHAVFGISQEKCDPEYDKSIWRAVKLPAELDETQDSVMLIDFGEIIQLTEHCQLYNISPKYQDYPPLAIKCILKGICDSDGIVSSDHGKCKEALLSNEYTMAKFRVITQKSRVLHVVILMEAKKESEDNPLIDDLKTNTKTNPFLDSLLLEEQAELEENGDHLYLPISSVYGHTPRVGPNSNIKAKIGDHLQITVTHVNSPISFYANVEDVFEEINEVFFWNDNELTSREKEISPPKLNDILLAQYSKDEHWYRAQVIDILAEDKQYKVFYIDFGNTEIVTLNALASCKRDLLNRPSQAIPFRLANLQLADVSEPLQKSWSSEEQFDNKHIHNLRKATESVVVILLNQTMTVQVVDRRGDELMVGLLDDQFTNIPSMLMNMGVVARRTTC